MLYRIVQEMINNSLKHAKAKKIELKIKVFQHHVHINYADNGAGFDVQKVFDNDSEAFGLRNMQSRVGFLNGEMNIDSTPGEGARFTLQVPI
jgi:signal transduction histidine kinase